MAARQWIARAIKHPGAFTKQAMKAHMSVSEMSQHVMANPGKYSYTTRKRAVLAKTLRGFHR